MQTSLQTFILPPLRVGSFSSKERDLEVLVIDICCKSCWLFSTKTGLGIFSDAVVAFSLLAVYQWSIVSHQHTLFEYCASLHLPHNNNKINRQKNPKTLSCQGWGSVKLTCLGFFLLGLNWWVILCNSLKSEWEYFCSFMQPSLQNFFSWIWYISFILPLNIAIM